jgi:hypothetical protein
MKAHKKRRINFYRRAPASRRGLGEYFTKTEELAPDIVAGQP